MARRQSQIRYAQSRNAKIAFHTLGSGQLDLILVPGLTSHLDLDWQNPRHRRFSQALARGCRLIQFDKRGTGLSDPTTSLPTLAERVEDVLAVLAATHSRRAVVFGLSDGGRTAVAVAVAYPERVRALILYGAAYHPPRAEVMRQLRSLVRHWGEGRIVDIFAPSIASAEVRRAAGAFERASASPAMARALIESLGLTDVRDRLDQVAIPTLVLHRDAEIIPVEEAHAVTERIPNAKLVVLPGRDHLPWVGDWAAVVQQVLTFLGDVAPDNWRPAPSALSERPRERPQLGWPSLTEAECAVVELVVEGLTNREIAERLFLSRYTVETHLKHVFSKLVVESRTELAALAVTEGKATNT
jgi:pimeloyl-ACP methyl ester carboxylesterase/DNA-binding CsgD family transcriptional regulator